MKSSFKILVFVLCFVGSFKAQTQDWVSLPQELNGDVRDMVEYQGKLIAAGKFSTSGSITLKSIAAWDGNQWTALGRGLRYTSAQNDNAYVNKLLVFNDELYAVGSFDSAGTVASQNIAKWNGNNWVSMATYVNGTIFAIEVFNNGIYIGGSFGGINNIAPYRIAKYNGSIWQTISAAITVGEVRDFCIYNNKLYVTGLIASAGGFPADNIASWDGSTWQGLTLMNNYTNFSARTMIEWNGNLLFANSANTVTSSLDILQWNNSTWSLFSQNTAPSVNDFCIFNNQLYCAKYPSNPGPQEESFIHLWNENSHTWNPVGTGINYGTLALCGYKGELFCGGSFNAAHNSPHNYIAKLSTITGIAKNAEGKLEVSAFPNPVKDQLNLEFTGSETGNVNLSIINTLGQTVLNTKVELQNSKLTIDLSLLQSGIYYLKMETGKTNKVLKLVKE